MRVAVVNMGAGNVRSVLNALSRLGCECILTDEVDKIVGAERIILPGQGEAANVMRHLREHRLDEMICSLRQPVLGICIGMQLLCSHSEEGDTDCIGIFEDTEVCRFRPSRHEDKVPQMGWNQIGLARREEPLFRDVRDGDFVYFVHSYYVPICPYTIAVTDYTLSYSAALRKGNFFATQFHPEKSGRVGERILKNFLEV